MKERIKIRETVNEPKNFAKAAAGLVAAAAGTAAIIGAVSGIKKAKEKLDVYEEVVVVAGDMEEDMEEPVSFEDKEVEEKEEVVE